MYKIIGTDQREYGPISADQMRIWLREGRVHGRTPVQAVGSADWKPLESFPELGSLLGAMGAPAGAAVPGQPAYLAGPRTNPLALIGMILGLFSMTFGLCCCYGLPFNLLGIVFSIIALVQIKNQPERYTGRGMAIAGLITSLLSFVLILAILAVGLAFSWQDIVRDLKKG